jgi:mono/diheme cytochrome c family protein
VTARADRITQAHDIFTNECARCHSAEKLRPKTSEHPAPTTTSAQVNGRTVQRVSGPDPLREWMETSHEDDPDTHCHAARLDVVQRELVISYLRKKEDPRARPWAPTRLAAAANGGITPAPKKLEPKLGQGDHR